MVKITRISPDAPHVTLRLDGRLVGPWVDELEHTCHQYLAMGSPVHLELSGLWFADGRGLQILRTLQAQGIQLRGMSLFLAGLLQHEG